MKTSLSDIKKILILALMAVCLFSLFLSSACKETPVVTELKAAIVDQLFSMESNQDFIQEAEDMLAGYGFKVDLYSGDQITVDLMRQLPSRGYRLIIYRAHAGLLGNEDNTILKTCVFTAEKYSEMKHVPDQLSDRLAKARVDESAPWVFAVGAEFIKNNGAFNGTVVIMMGCSTLYIPDLGQAFLAKGAAAYVGWDASLGLEYADQATSIFLDRLVKEKATLRQSVEFAMQEAGADPTWGAELQYLPPIAAEKTLDQMLKGTNPP